MRILIVLLSFVSVANVFAQYDRLIDPELQFRRISPVYNAMNDKLFVGSSYQLINYNLIMGWNGSYTTIGYRINSKFGVSVSQLYQTIFPELCYNFDKCGPNTINNSTLGLSYLVIESSSSEQFASIKFSYLDKKIGTEKMLNRLMSYNSLLEESDSIYYKYGSTKGFDAEGSYGVKVDSSIFFSLGISNIPLATFAGSPLKEQTKLNYNVCAKYTYYLNDNVEFEGQMLGSTNTNSTRISVYVGTKLFNRAKLGIGYNLGASYIYSASILFKNIILNYQLANQPVQSGLSKWHYFSHAFGLADKLNHG